MSCIFHDVTDKRVILQRDSVVGSVQFIGITYGDNIDNIDKLIVMRIESVVRDVPCGSRIGIV